MSGLSGEVGMDAWNVYFSKNTALHYTGLGYIMTFVWLHKYIVPNVFATTNANASAYLGLNSFTIMESLHITVSHW